MVQVQTVIVALSMGIGKTNVLFCTLKLNPVRESDRPVTLASAPQSGQAATSVLSRSDEVKPTGCAAPIGMFMKCAMSDVRVPVLEKS